jgi:transposase
VRPTNVFVRSLLPDEREKLEAGLHSRDAFTLRRCQILLASAVGQGPRHIARHLGCTGATVRNAIHAFEVAGVTCLQEKSSRPHTIARGVPDSKWDELRDLIHRSPRLFGKKRSTWTLELLAEVGAEQGITQWRLSMEAIRLTLERMGINWKRARTWMTSPDPLYAVKKARRDRLVRLASQHPDWVLGFEDEVWWSRLARPSLHAWTDGPPLKLQVLSPDDNDPDPEAICCYGILRNDTHKVALRFVEGRPLAEITIQFLDWVCWAVSKEGKRVLIVVWDNASWHTADCVAAWIRSHNESARQTGAVKLVLCELPVASPWLNNIEPCWTHANKAILEPDRKLTAAETMARVCEHFGCDLLPYLRATADMPP